MLGSGRDTDCQQCGSLSLPCEILRECSCHASQKGLQRGSLMEDTGCHSPGEVMMSGAVQPLAREVMDIRQASEYLGISGDTLYRYASEGFVPAFKLGNRWRFKKTLLDAWMEEKSGVRPAVPVMVLSRQKKPAGRSR